MLLCSNSQKPGASPCYNALCHNYLQKCPNLRILLMTQQYRNFTLRFVAFLFIKLPESENACKQNVRSSLAQTSNPVFSKSSAREIEQDNRQATKYFPLHLLSHTLPYETYSPCFVKIPVPRLNEE